MRRLAGVALALACGGVAALQSPIGNAQEAGSEWVLRQYRDPVSGELVEVRAPRTTQEALQPFRPTQLRQDSRFVAVMRGVGQQSRELVKAFPPETAMFLAAGGLVATRQLVTQGDMYPMALAHFIAYQVADPLNHASFAFFILANKAGNAVFDAAALRLGLMRDEVAFTRMVQQIARELPAPAGFADDLARGFVRARPSSLEHFDRILARAEAIAPRPVTHSFAGGFRAPLGLAAGVFASGLAYELMADPDLQRCFGSWMKSPRQIAVEMNEGQKAPFVACDHAYDRWVSTGMLMKQLPNIAGVVASFLTQSFVINPGLARAAVVAEAGARRYIPVLFRGFQLTRAIGATHPAGRLLMLVGHTYIFLELTHFYTPIMNRLINRPHLAERLRESERRLLSRAGEGWFAPACKERLEAFVRQRVAAGHEAVDLEQVEYDQLAHWLRSNASDCGPIEAAPSRAVQEHMALAGEWRQLTLAEANERLQQWTALVQGLVSANESAYRFYRAIIAAVNSTEGQEKLRQEAPFYNLGFRRANRLGEGGAEGLVEPRAVGERLADILVEARRVMAMGSNEGPLVSHAQRSLAPVLALWEALDERKPLNEPWRSALESILRFTLPEQARQAESQYRQKMFSRGLLLFRDLTRGEDFVRIAVGDEERPGPLSRLSQLIGDVEPLGRGRPFLKTLELDPQTLLPTANAQRTDGYSRAATPNLADHFLATMVCGPRVSQASGAEALVSRLPGFGIRFTPPRVIRDELPRLCDRVPVNLSVDRPLFSIHDGVFQLDGQSVRGFLAVVERALQDQFRGPEALVRFDRFWQERVDAQLRTLENELKGQFKELVDSHFLANFNSSEQFQIRQSRATLYSRSIGIFGSIRDDLVTLERLLAAKTNRDREEQTRLRQVFASIRQHLELMMASLVTQGEGSSAQAIYSRLLSADQLAKAEVLLRISQNAKGLADISVAEAKPLILAVLKIELAALTDGLRPLASGQDQVGERQLTLSNRVILEVGQLAEAIGSAAGLFATVEMKPAKPSER